MYQSQEKGAELEGEVDIHCCGSKYSERVGTVPMNIGLDCSLEKLGLWLILDANEEFAL